MPDLVPFEMSDELRALLGDEVVDNSALSEGVGGGFAVLSYRGKVWRVKHQGETKAVLNKDGDSVQAIAAVLVTVSSKLSKIYYAKAYEEGDDASPDCFSIDGVKPDPSSPAIQCKTCAGCPHNAWGSRVSEAGQKLKACSDSRRIAVVPYPDVKNEHFGGPMLLRVPPASLQNLAIYGKELTRMGIPFFAVATRVAFDIDAAYPKLTFRALKPLDREGFDVVREMQHSEIVERMFDAPETEVTEQAADRAPRTGGEKAGAAPMGDADEEVEAPAEEKPKAAEKPKEEKPKAAKPKEEKPKAAKPEAAAAAADEGVDGGPDLDGLLGDIGMLT